MRVIFPMCSTESYCTHCQKCVKYVSPSEKKGFRGIFVGIPQHQKRYIVYVPCTRKIIYSYDVVFDEFFSSMLAYMSQPYAEEMDICPSMSYTPYDTSLREQTGNIFTFAQFEEGNLLSKSRDDTKSGN